MRNKQEKEVSAAGLGEAPRLCSGNLTIGRGKNQPARYVKKENLKMSP